MWCQHNFKLFFGTGTPDDSIKAVEAFMDKSFFSIHSLQGGWYQSKRYAGFGPTYKWQLRLLCCNVCSVPQSVIFMWLLGPLVVHFIIKRYCFSSQILFKRTFTCGGILSRFYSPIKTRVLRPIPRGRNTRNCLAVTCLWMGHILINHL